MPEASAIFEPIEDVQSLKDRTYDALKQAITTMDIYASPAEPRLDERLLSEQLESMAARLITQHASDAEIASLRTLFSTPGGGQVQANIDEYSDRNIRFHQALLKMSHCDLLIATANNLFIHMRAIRAKTIAENDRASRSIIDHMNIIEALEQRDTELAEKLARQHTLDLAAHVEQNVHYLD